MKHHFRFGHIYPRRFGRDLPHAIVAMGSIMESAGTRPPPRTDGAARPFDLLAANAA